MNQSINWAYPHLWNWELTDEGLTWEPSKRYYQILNVWKNLFPRNKKIWSLVLLILTPFYLILTLSAFPFYSEAFLKLNLITFYSELVVMKINKIRKLLKLLLTPFRSTPSLHVLLNIFSRFTSSNAFSRIKLVKALLDYSWEMVVIGLKKPIISFNSILGKDHLLMLH